VTAAEIVLLVAVLVQSGLVLALLLRPRENVEKALVEGLVRVQDRVQQDLQALRGEVDRRLSESVAQNLQSFSAVADKLGKLHEATGQLVTLSQGVNDLNVILKTPQGRGAFGEMTLEQMLGDLFGEHAELYETQFTVEGAEKADAAIFVRPDRSQMLCVDAKFPLAHAVPLIEGKGTPEIERAFVSDVKARADEIRKKYIKPPRTLDFAFMFVPSEAVYYQVLRNAKLHEDLLRMRVVPTSPNAFYGYLQALSAAFRGMKIEQKTQEIQKAIVQIARDFTGFAQDYDRLGKKLDEAQKAYGDTTVDIENFKKRVAKLKIGEVQALPGAPKDAEISK
jgi:DNA recombination protein RmuC